MIGSYKYHYMIMTYVFWLINLLKEYEKNIVILMLFFPGIEIAVEVLKIASGAKDFLSHLPSNIICRILCQLDLRDIPIVARVCKKLANQVIKTHIKYYLYLFDLNQIFVLFLKK